MLFFERRFCLAFSLLQVVTALFCFLIKVESQTKPKSARNCAERSIELKCPQNATIAIKYAVLGYTSSSCCNCDIKDEQCRKESNGDRLISIRSRCNGQQRCQIMAEKGSVKYCNWWFWRSTTSEHIFYSCTHENGTSPSNASALNDTLSTDGSDDMSAFDGEISSEDMEETKITVVIVSICLGIVFIVIIIAIVFRQIKRQASKPSPKTEKLELVHKYEEVCINDNKELDSNRNTPTNGVVDSMECRIPDKTKTGKQAMPDQNASVYCDINNDEEANRETEETKTIYAQANHPHNSMADSFKDEIVYCEVETKEPYKTTQQSPSVYEKVCVDQLQTLPVSQRYLELNKTTDSRLESKDFIEQIVIENDLYSE